MAGKKKAAAAEPRTSAWANGDQAYGARYVRAASTFSAMHDLQLACGWPRVIELVDGHPLDADPTQSALAGAWSEVQKAPWPRQLAARFARMEAVSGYIWRNPPKPDVSEEGMAAAAKGGEIDAAEAHALIATFLSAKRHHYASHPFAFILEAFVGPDVVVDGALDALERMNGNEWLDAQDTRMELVEAIGSIALRARDDGRRDRMEALFARWGTPEPRNGGRDTARHALDRILHGREGVERSAFQRDGKKWPSDLAFVFDDEAFVARELAAFGRPGKWDAVDMRPYFRGGEAGLAIARAHWKAFVADGGAPEVFRQFSRLRSPEVAAMIAEMAEGSRAKVAARAWLEAHANEVQAPAPKPASAPKGEIALLCERLDAWFAKHADATPSFRQPATEEDIAAAEAIMGIALPEDYRAFLRAHDGQEETELQMIPGVNPLAPIASVASQWKEEQENVTGDGFDDLQDDGRIRSVQWHARRIPIAGLPYWDGDNTYLDLVPGPKGASGQVITMTSECDFVVLATSFRALLGGLAELLEGGSLGWSRTSSLIVPLQKGKPKKWSGHAAESLAKLLIRG